MGLSTIPVQKDVRTLSNFFHVLKNLVKESKNFLILAYSAIVNIYPRSRMIMKTKTRISKKNILTTTVKTTVAALVSAVMLEAGSAQAAIFIDDFSLEQLVESHENNENQKGPHGNIIGGYRGMFIQQDTLDKSKLEVKDGEARYSNDSGANATAEIFWNGFDSDRENTTGLDGIDITAEGTLNSIALDLKADFDGLEIDFYIYDMNGNNASISQSFKDLPNSPKDFERRFLSFNSFNNSNNLDFTNVGAMKLVLNGPESLDADISLIEVANDGSQAIPEPTSILGLLVIGATGAGSILKRKHNR